MDTSHHAIQYHLARALMHLNQLASFLPSFEIPADWGSNPSIPRTYPHNSAYQLARQLHRFVPLPTDSRPPPSLASHGDLPPHFVMNPEPHLQPILHRESHPAADSINREITITPLPSYEDIHMVDDHPHEYDRPAPRAKQASRSTAPRTIVYPENPDGRSPPPVRSSKRPRTTSMVESINRFGSPTREGDSSNTHPIRPAISDSEGPPPTARHTSLEVDSDDPDPGRAKAPSPSPTILGHTSSTRANPADSTHSTSNHLDPAVADHRNRPWPPCDDNELICYKMDTKSRPSWKTI